jgi:hypothetical protein
MGFLLFGLLVVIVYPLDCQQTGDTTQVLTGLCEDFIKFFCLMRQDHS